MHKSYLATLIGCWCVLNQASAQSEDAATSSVFQLGVVEVAGQQAKTTNNPSGVVIDQDDMQAHQDVSLADSLDRQPGVVIASGGRRAESSAFIRGFDSRQVTLNIDGIPVYIPYDGNIDLSRFLVTDLSQIVVSKGLGSLLYGPNNMGGSINLVSRRPQKPLEGRVQLGVGLDSAGVASDTQSLQLGGKLSRLFYAQAGISRADMGGFSLSDSFTATPAQPNGRRVHADSLSTTGNLKLGFTPNANDEYALSLYSTRGHKEAPLYAGSAPGNLVYWDWPQWDKDSIYWISHTALAQGYLKTRLYLDTFKNSLAIYKKDYSALDSQSQYDDQSLGGNIEYGLPLGNHLLKAAAFYKEDKHTETDLATPSKSYQSPWIHYKNETRSVGIEDTWSLTANTRISFGYRKDWMEVKQAEEYADKAKSSVRDMAMAGQKDLDNWQLFLLHDWQALTWRAGIAHKGRYPSIKEMYSYRMGRAIPNPNLQAEEVLHHEVGVAGKLGKAQFDVAAYYSRVSDAIEFVAINPTTEQQQNVGNADHYGVDLSYLQPIGQDFSFQLNYSWLRKSLSNSQLVATAIPEHRIYSTLSWYARPDTTLMLDVVYADKRQTTTDGLRPVAGYTLANLRAQYDYNANTSVNFGIYNLFDENYQISEGDPMPGRMVNITASYRF